MENCKHERCRWMPAYLCWHIVSGSFSMSVDFCPDCGARLEPPKPPVMTLEEVAADIGAWLNGAGTRIAMNNKVLQAWHRSITAHIEGEPRGLRPDECARLLRIAGRSYEFDDALWLRCLAARHTKGGK